jgi:hypothetical protein
VEMVRDDEADAAVTPMAFMDWSGAVAALEK